MPNLSTLHKLRYYSKYHCNQDLLHDLEYLPLSPNSRNGRVPSKEVLESSYRQNLSLWCSHSISLNPFSNQVHFYKGTGDWSGVRRTCLNPFSNQVHFYGLNTTLQSTCFVWRLNPFSNQVHFYTELWKVKPKISKSLNPFSNQVHFYTNQFGQQEKPVLLS